MTQPQLADADQLVVEVLSAAVGSVATVQEDLPPDYPDVLPLVRAHRWGGSADRGLWLDRAIVDVDVYAQTRAEAQQIAEACRTALRDAWIKQSIWRHGSITVFDEQSAPVRLVLPGELSKHVRVHATYQLHLSPP